MHKDNITVAEDWTELPPKAERNSTCTKPFWKRASGWHGLGCYWRATTMRNLCARTLAKRKLLVENRLGFPVVALPA